MKDLAHDRLYTLRSDGQILRLWPQDDNASGDRRGNRLAATLSSMGRYSMWGSWGLLEYHDQPTTDAPKYQAVLEFLDTNPRWW